MKWIFADLFDLKVKFKSYSEDLLTSSDKIYRLVHLELTEIVKCLLPSMPSRGVGIGGKGALILSDKFLMIQVKR